MGQLMSLAAQLMMPCCAITVIAPKALYLRYRKMLWQSTHPLGHTKAINLRLYVVKLLSYYTSMLRLFYPICRLIVDKI